MINTSYYFLKVNIIILLVFLYSCSIVLTQIDTTKNTIIKNEKPQTTIEKLQNIKTEPIDTNKTKLPSGDETYTKEQDSLFNMYISNSIPFRTKLYNGLQFSNSLWLLQRELNKGTPWQIALQNLRNIPQELFIPSGVEMVHRQLAIKNSFYIPYMNSGPRPGLFYLDDAAKLLGLIEDLSPEIHYTLDFSTDVEIVIYSISSTVVATLFNGRQVPGSYTFTWNGRDKNGQVMPKGDYIAEVRVGKEKYIRKRIYLN